MKNQTAYPIASTIQEIAIAKEAFIYGLPLVLFDLTKEQSTNYVTATSDGAPVNQFSNKSNFPDADDTSVVRPNCDTYYSIAFLDLSDGPVVMSVPPTGEEFYMLPLLDAYTNVIPNSPGTRTEDKSGGDYLIVGPSSGIPAGTDTSNFIEISSPTNLVWILGRFQVNNPNTDGKVAIQLQAKLGLTPLSAWGTPYSPPEGNQQYMDSRDPNTIVATMSINEFFARMNNLLVGNPPTADDAEAMAKFRKIGVGIDVLVPFNEMEFSPEVMDALNKIPSKTLATLEKLSNQPSDSATGWSGLTSPTMGNFGTEYFQRAMIAYIGLGANLIEDAVYYKTLIDENRNSLDGSKKYIMTFDTAPPVNTNAFWSLTMYNSAGFFIENEIDRYALGHSDNAPLKWEDDGSLKIFIQNQALEKSDPYYNNWLPAPTGEFNLLFRAYWPDEPILNGTWEPPVVQLNQA